MNMNRLISKSRIFLFFIFNPFLLYSQHKRLWWEPKTYAWNLQSDQAYTHYLPERVKELRTIISQKGMAGAVQDVLSDDDLESYWFILRASDPVIMLAYSRQPQLCGKTAQEIQQLIFPQCDTAVCKVHIIFDQMRSAAKKGGTFIPYVWRFDTAAVQKYQVAYVQSLVIDEQSYIIGAALFTDDVPSNIILKHQVETVIKKIKKEGLEAGIGVISNDPDPEYYFFLVTLSEPMRWIAHGRNPWLVSRTPEEAQAVLFPQCKAVYCRLDVFMAAMRELALRGGGYYTYLWRAKPTDPVQLKVSYVLPIVYNKRKMFIGTGVTPPMVPEYAATELPKKAEYVVKLVHDIGLDSTLSVIKRENTSRLYCFILEQDPPYTVRVHLAPEFSERRANELHWNTKKQSVPKDFSMEKLMKSFAQFSKKGSGFFAYDYPVEKPGAFERMKIKVAYIRPFTVGRKNYLVGVTYQ